MSPIDQYISEHKVTANLTYAHTVRTTLKLEDFPGTLFDGNDYRPVLQLGMIKDALMRCLANELSGVRTRDINLHIM